MHAPLFSERFCHTTDVKFDDVANVGIAFTQCKPDTAEADCVAPCVYNNGVNLYPTTDFCSVSWMNPDITAIEACAAKSDSQANCQTDKECAWYKGKIVDANDKLIAGADLFGANFCHPPTTTIFEQFGETCFPLDNE
jgi:hypothetical protein